MLCLFSRIIVIGSPLGPVRSPATGSQPDLQYQDAFPPLECLTSNQKVIGYPHVFASVSDAVIVAQRVHRQVRVLMTFLSETRITSSGVMDTIQKDGIFLFSTNLISPQPVIKVYGVPFRRVLPLSSGGPPGAMAIGGIISGLLVPTPQQLEGRYLIP